MISTATVNTAYSRFFKRSFDLLFSVVLFSAALPFFAATALFLFFVNGGTPFFLQPRPGKRGKTFKIIKFKTMNNKKNVHGALLPDADRLTPVGRFVRKTSLDELPQLINVIKGDMSLVGPRPLLLQYLPLYSERQQRRHEVRPGITGWAQVNGRNAISWERKFEYDVYYVENLSLFLDLKILWRTIRKVFKSEGVSSATSPTMEPFTGNHP